MAAKMKRINLLPRDLRPKIEVPPGLLPGGTAVVCALYVATSVSTLFIKERNQLRELASLQQENAEMTRKIEAVSSQKRVEERDSDRFASLQKVLSRKNYWSEVFKELAGLVPEGLWLTTLSQAEAEGGAPRKLILKGEAFSPMLVADFFKTLEVSDHFSGAMMTFSERDSTVRPPRYKFEFTVPITGLNEGGGA